MDLYNLLYDEFQNNIVQPWRNNFPDDDASLIIVRERMIVEDNRKNPNAIFEANFAFAVETRSNIQYFTVENEKLAQNL